MESTAENHFYNKRNIMIAGIIAIGIIIIFLMLGSMILNQKTLYAHVYIGTTDVSNLSKAEAKQKLEDAYEKGLEDFQIKIAYEGNYWDLNYKDIGYTYLYDQSIEEAYKLGRQGNYLERLRTVYNMRNSPMTVPLEYSYDIKRLDAFLDEIEANINKEPKDAIIKRENNTFVIQKEQLGFAVEADTLKTTIIDRIESFNRDTITVPVKVNMPRVTAEKLKNIQEVISEFSTVFNPQIQGRTTNISIAANSINGTVIMPGEEFSFNDQTGPRGVAEGYQEAPVIIKGELVPGIGGGICQISTTLYNAVVRADLEVTRRHNHSLPSTYVPLGQDATVVYGYIDFTFVNSSAFPLYVESYKSGNRAYVKIYGKKTQNTVIDLHSQITETIEPKIIVKQDPAMYIGETKFEKEAKKGYRVSTYKIYSENGKEIKRELITKDYYAPIHGVLLEGTKPKPVSEKIENPEQPKPDEFTDIPLEFQEFLAE
jgi:vancomycin resistance protein YoaR